MKKLIKRYDELVSQCNDIFKEKSNIIIDLVEKIQKETFKDHIQFIDDIKPTFFDETIGEAFLVDKARVNIGRLELTTENDTETWFNPNVYGELDTDEFVTIIENMYM